MDGFIGREEELNALKKAYHKEGFQMEVVYGRSRGGSMVKKFVFPINHEIYA